MRVQQPHAHARAFLCQGFQTITRGKRNGGESGVDSCRQQGHKTTTELLQVVGHRDDEGLDLSEGIGTARGSILHSHLITELVTRGQDQVGDGLGAEDKKACMHDFVFFSFFFFAKKNIMHARAGTILTQEEQGTTYEKGGC